PALFGRRSGCRRLYQPGRPDARAETGGEPDPPRGRPSGRPAPPERPTPMNLRLDHLLEELRTRGPDILRAVDADPLPAKKTSGERVLANAGPLLFTPQEPHQLYAKGVVYRRDPHELVSLPLIKIYNLGERDVSVHDIAGLADETAH